METNGVLDEDYTYDGLNRLVDTNRNGTDLQSWNLDSLGNWSSFTDEGTTEERTFNAANEIQNISSPAVPPEDAVSPEFDAAGNMISGPRPDDPLVRQHYIYDAWNRLVEVRADNPDNSGSPGDAIATFEYDGRNFRIGKTVGGVLEAFYYNEQQQLLETQVDGAATEEYVWDNRYIDAPILRATPGEVLYYANDANFNVTALVDAATGLVVERYHYDPYGEVLFMEADWTPRAASAFDNAVLYTGRRLDTETGLFYYRARYYDAALGRFINRDPIGYGDGMNVYQYVKNGPLNGIDPSGRIKRTYEVLEMTVDNGNTANTVIAEINVEIRVDVSNCSVAYTNSKVWCCRGKALVHVKFEWVALTGGSQHIIGTGPGTNPFRNFPILIWHDNTAANLEWSGTVNPNGSRVAAGSTISKELLVAEIPCYGGNTSGKLVTTGGRRENWVRDNARADTEAGNPTTAGQVAAGTAHFHIDYSMKLQTIRALDATKNDAPDCGVVESESISLSVGPRAGLAWPPGSDRIREKRVP